jgi:hypothetical protein
MGCLQGWVSSSAPISELEADYHRRQTGFIKRERARAYAASFQNWKNEPAPKVGHNSRRSNCVAEDLARAPPARLGGVAPASFPSEALQISWCHACPGPRAPCSSLVKWVAYHRADSDVHPQRSGPRRLGLGLAGALDGGAPLEEQKLHRRHRSHPQGTPPCSPCLACYFPGSLLVAAVILLLSSWAGAALAS